MVGILFKEYGKTTWIITDKIKILRILPEAERQEILMRIGYDENKEWEFYRNAIIKRKKNQENYLTLPISCDIIGS